jgi:NADH:ubiquinone oxidoreductase subunit F (NADH-binding)
MASLEGKVGRPRAKYVHTVEKGFRQSPSNLNNVETYANVPAIILKGADWYAGMGTEHSKGTKVFSLVGKIKNTGLVEVPMGISLRRSSSTSAAAFPKRRNSRPFRPAALRAAASPKGFWICRSISENWPKSAPSWAPAA